MSVAEQVLSFEVKMKWDHETSSGLARSGSRMPLVIGSPPEFGGSETNWSPEHLLTASVASCYATTFLHFARLLKVTVHDFRISGRTDFEKRTNGLEATRVVLRPVVSFHRMPEQSMLDNLLAKAKKYCFISNSIKCEVVVEPNILQG